MHLEGRIRVLDEDWERGQLSYRVKTDAFEGPFDLLLHLVARQKVDIGAISIVDIIDQYLAYIDRMNDLDLDVASDFLLVASQLLEIKAAALLPREEEVPPDEYGDLSIDEAREILIARLIAYRQFSSAAKALGARMENESRMHPRSAGIEEDFLNLMPDYLEGVTLKGLAIICADLAMRRDVFLLEAEHIAAMPIPLELHVDSVFHKVRSEKRTTFRELLAGDDAPEIVVVTFLALLELYKRQAVTIRQVEQFGDIEVAYLGEPMEGENTSDDTVLTEGDILTEDSPTDENAPVSGASEE